eukprot:7389320-Prymnesium_polylepis.1
MNSAHPTTGVRRSSASPARRLAQRTVWFAGSGTLWPATRAPAYRTSDDEPRRAAQRHVARAPYFDRAQPRQINRASRGVGGSALWHGAPLSVESHTRWLVAHAKGSSQMEPL